MLQYTITNQKTQEQFTCNYTDEVEDLIQSEMHGNTFNREDFIVDKQFACRGCQEFDKGDIGVQERYDAHGITTGNWCEECYGSSKYPYRKDRYPTIETHGYGEQLGDDY